MKEVEYEQFSWLMHRRHWQLKKPNVCQFELTFKCGLHCLHCYTDCYNTAALQKIELKCQEIKLILNKLYKANVLWLCFSGGDPLAREDFLEIYSYAKNKGFVITIFTNGYSITNEIIRYFKRNPPFSLEITLNAVNQSTYERIAQVSGVFDKTIQGVEKILKAKLPLKIKTQIMRTNLKNAPKIKRFIEALGLKFNPSFELYPRLNGDLSPCDLRVPAEVASGLIVEKDPQASIECKKSADLNRERKLRGKAVSNNSIFRCAVASRDAFRVDPYGNMFLCNLIRNPVVNLLAKEIEYGFNMLLPAVTDRKFITNSKCKFCQIQDLCWNCPGIAYLETKDAEGAVEYFCSLAKNVYRSNYGA